MYIYLQIIDDQLNYTCVFSHISFDHFLQAKNSKHIKKSPNKRLFFNTSLTLSLAPSVERRWQLLGEGQHCDLRRLFGPQGQQRVLFNVAPPTGGNSPQDIRELFIMSIFLKPPPLKFKNKISILKITMLQSQSKVETFFKIVISWNFGRDFGKYNF